MNGDQYQKTLDRLGLSQVAAARFLWIEDSTSRRWIADVHPIPRSVEMLLRLMIKQRLSADDVLKSLKLKAREPK